MKEKLVKLNDSLPRHEISTILHRQAIREGEVDDEVMAVLAGKKNNSLRLLRLLWLQYLNTLNIIVNSCKG